MSANNSLYYRLGPEGRKLLNMQSRSARAVPAIMPDSATDLDFLFDELLHPKQSTTPAKILSYLAYYYPKIKNTHNVQVLTACFLNCPLFFSNTRVFSLEESCRVVDCYRYVINKKCQISEPTVPFYSFYRSIFNAIYAFVHGKEQINGWKVYSIICGCVLSSETAEEYDPFPQYFELKKDVDKNMLKLFTSLLLLNSRLNLGQDIVYLQLICMACLQNYLGDDIYGRLDGSLPQKLITLIFSSPYGFTGGNTLVALKMHPLSKLVNQKPALLYLSQLSALFKKFTLILPETQQSDHVLDISLNNVGNCSDRVFHIAEAGSANADQQKLLKQCLFSMTTVFEAVSLRICQSKLADPMYGQFCRKILTSLFNINFVTEEVGTGGFDTYNFVYTVTSQYLREKELRTTEMLISAWLASLRDIATSKPWQAKLLFWMNYVEGSLKFISEGLKFDVILPTIDNLIKAPPSQPVLEGAHSVMLQYIAQMRDQVPDSRLFTVSGTKLDIQSFLTGYFKLVLSQFPDKLSLNQLDIIIESLARTVFPNSRVYDTYPQLCSSFQNLLYNQCAECIDVHLEEEKQSGTGFTRRKTALTSALVKVTPLFLTSSYVAWLQRIKSGIVDQMGSSPERLRLSDAMWNSILTANKYYPDKGALGIQWWYNEMDKDSKL